MAASRGADSPRHLRDRIPRPRREIFPERLLDQRHEHRTLRSRQIGAEDFAILDRENARTVQLDGQRDFRFGPAAQKRDDAFCLGIDLEAFVRICLQQLPQLFDRSHDRDERLAEVFLHGGLSLLLKRLFRCATSVEYHIATAEHRLYVGESGGFKSRLERRHFAVHRHDASEKSRIAWHGPKLASCRIPHPSNDYWVSRSYFRHSGGRHEIPVPGLPRSEAGTERAAGTDPASQERLLGFHGAHQEERQLRGRRGAAAYHDRGLGPGTEREGLDDRRTLRRDEGAAGRLLPDHGEGPEGRGPGGVADTRREARHRGSASDHGVQPTVDTIESVYRAESRRVLATLIRLLGDFDLAEEALQDAFAAALERWPVEGTPANPRSWLISAGRFQAIDRLRKTHREVASEADVPLELSDSEAYDVVDDRLRLIFTCCHPALNPDAQVAMTLREVCGLTTEQVAAAFLTTAPTLAQRIVRAKS